MLKLRWLFSLLTLLLVFTTPAHASLSCLETIENLSIAKPLSKGRLFLVPNSNPSAKELTLPSHDGTTHKKGPDSTGAGDAYQKKVFRSENHISRKLAELGFDIIQNPKESTLEHQSLLRVLQKEEGLQSSRSPDYIIEGKVFDHAMPQRTSGLSVIMKAIKKKVYKKKQTHRLVLDLRNNKSFNSGKWSVQQLHQRIKNMTRKQVWEVIILVRDQMTDSLITVFPKIRKHETPPMRPNNDNSPSPEGWPLAS